MECLYYYRLLGWLTVCFTVQTTQLKLYYPNPKVLPKQPEWTKKKRSHYLRGHNQWGNTLRSQLCTVAITIAIATLGTMDVGTCRNKPQSQYCHLRHGSRSRQLKRKWQYWHDYYFFAGELKFSESPIADNRESESVHH